MLKFALYVSNHGYGHASRISALAEELLNFGVFCHIISAKPAFLYNNLDPNYFSLHNRSLDFGVVHGPNLVVDKEATISKMLKLLSMRNEIMEQELEFIRKEQIDMIISDAPFLCFDFASYAEIPAIAITNFEWHYIYKNLFADKRELLPVINTIWAMYQKAGAFLRLPFSTDESVAAYHGAVNCGLLARKKEHYTNMRKVWALDKQIKLLLVMFGGEGAMEMDYESLCAGFEGKVISTNTAVQAANHILVFPDDDFLDLVYNADYILCKPGYSTLAEAVQFGKFIIYCPRRNYPEEIALIEGLKDYPNCLELDSLMHKKDKWRRIFRGISPKPFRSKKYRNSNREIAGKVISAYLKETNSDNLLSVFDLGTNNMNYALYDLPNNRVIHRAHVTTGLGIGFTGGLLNRGSIRNTKHSIEALMTIDSYIESRKSLLATGVCRHAENAGDVLLWATKKYGIQASIISTQDEIRYVKHAAMGLKGGEEDSIAVDIGGFSTEIIRLSADSRTKGISLNIGLLHLKEQFSDKQLDIHKEIDKQLALVPIDTSRRIIGIGLTFSYLAAVIYKLKHTDSLHGLTISKYQLQSLIANIEAKNECEYLPWLLSPLYLPILKLSIAFCISLLDRFSASDIIVCIDGISVGFARWTTSKYKKKDTR